ncbi:hypothetical protein [Metabacillus idriensis]|nr:hypothetical protein [Metabacillus idriensis]
MSEGDPVLGSFFYGFELGGRWKNENKTLKSENKTIVFANKRGIFES